jgi:tRNA threonylcarbamoyladenosine biosynthesis protein TsaE
MNALQSRIFDISGISDLDQVAGHLARQDLRLVLITGDLGAGKTTLVKNVCAALGSKDEVTSPTISLVNEYRDAAGNPVFHIDLYRLGTLEEAIQIGIEEYLHSGHWCFIEWPELIHPLTKDIGHIVVDISIIDDGRRRICILK